jgi:prepilin-type processing-associated H-X9-DG protein
MPALGKAKEKSRQIACAGNMTQFGQAFAMYESDYDGFTSPMGISWGSSWAYWDLRRTTGGYLGITAAAIPWDFRYKCPSTGATENGCKPELGYIISYGGNSKMQLLKVCQIKNPSGKLIVKDQSARVIWGHGSLDPVNDENSMYRHNNGANILFVDGHVGWNLMSWIIDNKYELAD